MKINDIVTKTPSSYCNAGLGRVPPMAGRVVYIHPLGRFYVVEFRSAVTGESFREAFYPPEREGPLYDGDPVRHRKFHPEVKRRGYHQKKRRKST